MASLDAILPALQSILVSGLVLASLYALMAIGLSLVWTTLGVFNFAHGVFMTLGAYIAWTVADDRGLGFGLAAGFAVAVAVVAGLGVLADKLLVSPFLGRKDIVLIAVMTTLSAAFFLENAALLIWGPRIKQLDKLVEGNVRLVGVPISAHEFVIILLAPLVLFALWAFLKFSWIGAAIRAVAQNRDAALLVGIDVRLAYSVAFALSAGLAGMAGVLLGAIRFITPGMGAEPLLKAFIVVILGGLGSFAGTAVGAYAVGFLESSSTYFVGAYWTQAILFALFILILILRPTGLLGRR